MQMEWCNQFHSDLRIHGREGRTRPCMPLSSQSRQTALRVCTFIAMAGTNQVQSRVLDMLLRILCIKIYIIFEKIMTCHVSAIV